MCSFPVIYLGPNYGGGNNNNGNLLQKVPCTHCYTQCPQSCSRLQQATSDPHLHQRHSQANLVSLLWGHCSFLLGPGVHKVLFVPFKSLIFPVLNKFCSSIVGLIMTSSKRVYAIPKSAAPRAPASVVVHC